MQYVNRKKLNILIIIGVIIFGIIAMFRGEKGIELKVGEEDITISVASEQVSQINYKDIKEITFDEKFEIGQYISKVKVRGIEAGICKNDQLGEYKLYTYKKIPCAIVLKTNDGNVVVFNYENKHTTEQFYKTLKDYIETKVATHQY